MNAVKKRRTLLKSLFKYKFNYLLIFPAVLWYVIFQYIPMYGITLAFKDFRYDRGLLGSAWAGLRYLNEFLTYGDSWKIIWNTLIISGLKMIFSFPAPIILALMLNEVKNIKFKRTIQTISYLPYFVSWVVVISLFSEFLTPYGGPANALKVGLFGGDPVFFMGEQHYFYPLVIITEIWKNIGWGSIIYLAALTGISPELYEAAYIDGAGRWKSLIHISLPSLAPTIGIMFLFSVSVVLKSNFDQIYLMQNPSVMDLAETLDTHLVKQGILLGKFSYATAVGLFQSLLSLILILGTNKISRKLTDISLW